jgi:hypothetical protein
MSAGIFSGKDFLEIIYFCSQKFNKDFYTFLGHFNLKYISEVKELDYGFVLDHFPHRHGHQFRGLQKGETESVASAEDEHIRLETASISDNNGIFLHAGYVLLLEFLKFEK